MIELNPSEKFAPSDVTRRKWLHSPKQKKKIAGITLHGLFGTHHYSRCWQALAAIIVIEAITLYQFYIVTNHSKTIIFIVIAAAISDFILAFLSHKNKDDIQIYLNEISTEDTPEAIQLIEKKLAPLKFFQKIIFGIIIFLAVIKCLAFFAYYRQPNGLFIFISSLYLLEAYLHISFTGYIWYTQQFINLFKKEHDQYISSSGKQNTFSVDEPKGVIIKTPVALKENTQGRQEIKKDENNIFRLLTRGILTDDEILRLSSSQENVDAQRAVIKAGIKHQLRLMQENG